MEKEMLEKIKKMLTKALDEYSVKSRLSVSDLEMVHKLTDTIKNIDKICTLEDEGGYSERSGRMMYRGTASYDGDSSYDDYSEARGRGRNAKRDSMGRYARDNDSYESESSYARGSRGGYSRDGAKGYMIEKIEEMMEDADSEKEREALRRCMHSLKNA